MSDAVIKSYWVFAAERDDIPPDVATTFWLDEYDEYIELTPQQGALDNPRRGSKNGRLAVEVAREWLRNRDVSVLQSGMERGAFHPRIWRNGIMPIYTIGDPNPRLHQRPSEFAALRPRLIAFHQIQRRLADVFEVVTPRPENSEAFGTTIQQVLALAAMEVETLLRDAFNANHRIPPKNSTMSQWARLAAPTRLGEWVVELSWFPEWQRIQPFDCWGQKTPSWWTAYNKLKHDDVNRTLANLSAAVSAVASIRILIESQFGLGASTMIEDGGSASFTGCGFRKL